MDHQRREKGSIPSKNKGDINERDESVENCARHGIRAPKFTIVFDHEHLHVPLMQVCNSMTQLPKRAPRLGLRKVPHVNNFIKQFAVIDELLQFEKQ